MRFAVATAFLVQTLPVASSSVSEANNKVDSLGTTPLIRSAQKEFSKDALVPSSEGNIKNRSAEAILKPQRDATLSKEGALTNQIIECKPLLEDSSDGEDEADVGILGCGPNQYCAESYESSLGGVCMDIEGEQIYRGRRRRLKKPEVLDPTTCQNPANVNAGTSCDCSLFNTETQQGYFSCSQTSCLNGNSAFCGYLTNTRAISEGSDVSADCIGVYTPTNAPVNTPTAAPVPDAVCYGAGDSDGTYGCFVTVRGEVCDSCVIAGQPGSGCFIVNCANTDAGPQARGNTCVEPYVLEALFPDAFAAPTGAPTDTPTKSPTSSPTPKPSTQAPTASGPTAAPVPTPAPTDSPAAGPTDAPVAGPTDAPVAGPTDAPVAGPTDAPVAGPTDAPVAAPTDAPVAAPTDAPVASPTEAPVPSPTEKPTDAPVPSPTEKPTDAPVPSPTEKPTEKPTKPPKTKSPTEAPKPTDKPTEAPVAPKTNKPTNPPKDDDEVLVGSSQTSSAESFLKLGTTVSLLLIAASPFIVGSTLF